MEEAAASRELSAVQQRDALFESLYTEFQHPIAGYLRRMVGDPDLAADLTQDVFLKAYKAMDSLQPGPTVRSWLYTIATNVAISYHRRRKLLKWLPLAPTTGRVVGPEERVGIQQELDEALATLQPDHAACLLLSARDGFTYEEIGEMLGISPGAAKTRAYRARLAVAHAIRESRSR